MGTIATESRPHCPPIGNHDNIPRDYVDTNNSSSAPPNYNNVTAGDLPSYEEVMRNEERFST